MAQVIDTFPESRRGKNLNGPKYPYEQWFDGQVWKLERGEGKDFTVKTTSMRTGLAHAAKRSYGGDIKSTIVDDDTLVIQFTKS